MCWGYIVVSTIHALHYVVNLAQTHHLSYFFKYTDTRRVCARRTLPWTMKYTSVHVHNSFALVVARVGFKGARAQLRIFCLSCIRDVVCGANIQARALTRRSQECSECTLFYLHNRVCIFIKYTVLLWPLAPHKERIFAEPQVWWIVYAGLTEHARKHNCEFAVRKYEHALQMHYPSILRTQSACGDAFVALVLTRRQQNSIGECVVGGGKPPPHGNQPRDKSFILILLFL